MSQVFMFKRISLELAALEQLEREYEAAVCAVCAGEKWPRHPFCRRCSIKLQRAKMMTLLRHYAGSDWLTWHARIIPIYFATMDVCRDYLVNRRRERAA